MLRGGEYEMKKIIMTLAVAFVLALVSTTKVSAVTIDGSINPAGEWAGATIIPVASSMGTVSVITDTNFMYVLFDVIDSLTNRYDVFVFLLWQEEPFDHENLHNESHFLGEKTSRRLSM